jgi:hypothetical protein
MHYFNNKRKNDSWTREDKLKLVELNNKNIPSSEIAKHFNNRTKSSVVNALRRMGWKVNNTK